MHDCGICNKLTFARTDFVAPRAPAAARPDDEDVSPTTGASKKKGKGRAATEGQLCLLAH